MPTMNEIQNMTDAQIADLNNKLAKQILKRIALTSAVVLVVHMAVDVLVKKMDHDMQYED